MRRVGGGTVLKIFVTFCSMRDTHPLPLKAKLRLTTFLVSHCHAHRNVIHLYIGISTTVPVALVTHYITTHLLYWYIVPLRGDGDEHVARPGEREEEGGIL